MNKLLEHASMERLFPARPTLPFRSTRIVCPRCQARLQVLKTRTKSVATMHIGEFIADETLLHCVCCDSETIYVSEELLQLTPSRCKFGYDVLIYVGQALFVRHRNNQEIINELTIKNIRISSSEISYLGKKFIVYLSIAHQQCALKIQESMQNRGGYILHLDATYDNKSPMLMSGLDSITEIVLNNIKLSSEHADQIIPFLRQIKKMFGCPLALVHDMGAGILKAVKEVFPNLLDFICHFHFLRDIGKDLFGEEYNAIRKRLKKHKIASQLQYRAGTLKRIIDDNPQLIEELHSGIENKELPDSVSILAPVISAYSLIIWALDGKNQGNGYGFPFDRPHLIFAKRLIFLYEQLEELKYLQLRGEWRDNKPFFKLSNVMKPIVADTVLHRTLPKIEAKIKVFDQLRDAMRIAPKSGSQGLNCDGDNTNIKIIEKRVTAFRANLTGQPGYSNRKDYQKFIAQLNKYWEKLFADPIVVNTPRGPVIIQPQRTNNIMERFFRDFRRGNRRKTGNNSLSKTLKSMLADTPLVNNLTNPHYIDILLDGKATLQERFAEIEITKVREELSNAQKVPRKIPAKIKKIIIEPGFPGLVTKLFRRHILALAN
ncbi:MAG: transposase [Candidatus Auribacterota bacterium]|nr:transposase [Candidatus Auribacterota bacterium]